MIHKLFQQNFCHVHGIHKQLTHLLSSHVWKARWHCFNTSSVWMDNIHCLSYQILAQGALSQEVPLSCDICGKYRSCCTEHVLQQSGEAKIRGTYQKMSSQKKAEIGKQAAEHRGLATVHYYTTKLPEPLKESSVCNWKNAYTAQLQRLRMEGKDNQEC